MIQRKYPLASKQIRTLAFKHAMRIVDGVSVYFDLLEAMSKFSTIDEQSYFILSVVSFLPDCSELDIRRRLATAIDAGKTTPKSETAKKALRFLDSISQPL